MTGKEKVLEFLKNNPASTDEEIALSCNMNPSSARTRRHELEIDGLIVPVGTTSTSSGRKTYIWTTIEKFHTISWLKKKGKKHGSRSKKHTQNT